MKIENHLNFNYSRDIPVMLLKLHFRNVAINKPAQTWVVPDDLKNRFGIRPIAGISDVLQDCFKLWQVRHLVAISLLYRRMA